MIVKCEICNQEVLKSETVTYKGKVVCKICKVKDLQNSNKAYIGGRKKTDKVFTPEQIDFILKNKDKLRLIDLAVGVKETPYQVRKFLTVNNIKRNFTIGDGTKSSYTYIPKASRTPEQISKAKKKRNELIEKRYLTDDVLVFQTEFDKDQYMIEQSRNSIYFDAKSVKYTIKNK